jgi:K+-transporting ATPase ATPase C chain
MMASQLRACAWLLGLTLLLCAVFYPLILLGIGQTLFRDKAQGSLVTDAEGQVIGSRLLAQPFSADEYFWPRPSAASYNGASSGASNWGGSNYLLRDRVARTLGPIVKYKGTPPNGKTVQEDVKDWFQKKSDPVTEWAEAHEGVAQAWVNADDKHKAAVSAWQTTSPDARAAVAAWKKDHPDAGEPKPADLAKAFFKSNAKAFHKQWPKLIDDASWSVEAVFFDQWRQDNPEVSLEEVPADLVTASGSGLDPHITLDNARYQLKVRVANAWTDKLIKDGKIRADEARQKEIRDRVNEDIVKLLNDHASAPLGGLAGVPLVNVLGVNLAVRDRMRDLGEKLR